MVAAIFLDTAFTFIFWGFAGFGIGITLAVFYEHGISCVFSDIFIMFVRWRIPYDPRNLSQLTPYR